ncbi:hypothetical protein KW785_01295 [Candidatus Parcubacteria bacterium]|nr:hypothetical protein [Candidatus Parcubacteria bacterium]
MFAKTYLFVSLIIGIGTMVWTIWRIVKFRSPKRVITGGFALVLFFCIMTIVAQGSLENAEWYLLPICFPILAGLADKVSGRHLYRL